MTQEQFIDLFLNKEYILSGYACLYKDHHNGINISSKALEALGALRKKFKKMMEASPHGSDDYVYYRILQLTYKVLMNSYYGILGEKNSAFYNPFVQNSITLTGQDLITTSIVSLEAALSNNVPFEDTDDVLTFLYNIKELKGNSNEILNYIDDPVTKDELNGYLKNLMKNPDVYNEKIIYGAIENLSLAQIQYVYYANNILKLIDNSWFMNKLKELTKYKYADSPAPEMVDDLNKFKAAVLDGCFYNNIYEDRYKRAMKDKRKSIIVIDTDSNFINVNPHIIHVTEMLKLDKNNEEQQMTVMNIFVNIITDMLADIFWKLTTNMGVVDEAKPLINMKSEFVYKRILLTGNKKSYAGIITAELGKLLDKPSLDMKGLSLRKTSVPRKLREEFTKILTDDILKAEKINLKEVLNKYDALGNTVEESLKDGKTDYVLPKNIESISNYKAPDTIEQIRGLLVWNELEPESQIIPPEKVNIIKLNCFEESDPRLESLKQTHPDKYNKIMKVVFNHGVQNPTIDISRFGLSCIAIPKNIDKIPDYILPFIDYSAMKNNNMTNGYIILESLGIYVDAVNTTKYKSNIIEI